MTANKAKSDKLVKNRNNYHILLCIIAYATFLSSDSKRLLAHAWQNPECPQGTKLLIAHRAVAD